MATLDEVRAWLAALRNEPRADAAAFNQQACVLLCTYLFARPPISDLVSLLSIRNMDMRLAPSPASVTACSSASSRGGHPGALELDLHGIKHIIRHHDDVFLCPVMGLSQMMSTMASQPDGMDEILASMTEPMFHAEGNTRSPMQLHVFLRRLAEAMRASGHVALGSGEDAPRHMKDEAVVHLLEQTRLALASSSKDAFSSRAHVSVPSQPKPVYGPELCCCCGKTASSRCSRCHNATIRYCSRECQAKDWRMHKRTCVAL